MKKRWVGGLALVLSCGLGLGYVTGRARAAGIPAQRAMTYSGVLTDVAGTALTGNKSIRVSLWDQASGGTEQCSVAETQTLAAGAFSISLADGCTTAVRDHADLWVEVRVDGSSLGRTKLGAVPYAVEADRASRATGALDTRIGTLDTRIGSLDTAVTAVDTRVNTLETRPAPTFEVKTLGSMPCQLLTNLRTPDATNVLVQTGPLFADSSCTVSADSSCHPICAALAVKDPSVDISGCCAVGPYYTKGLVEILAYR